MVLGLNELKPGAVPGLMGGASHIDGDRLPGPCGHAQGLVRIETALEGDVAVGASCVLAVHRLNLRLERTILEDPLCVGQLRFQDLLPGVQLPADRIRLVQPVLKALDPFSHGLPVHVRPQAHMVGIPVKVHDFVLQRVVVIKLKLCHGNPAVTGA